MGRMVANPDLDTVEYAVSVAGPGLGGILTDCWPEIAGKYGDQAGRGRDHPGQLPHDRHLREPGLHYKITEEVVILELG